MITRRTALKSAAAASLGALSAPFIIAEATAQTVTLRMQGFLASSQSPQKAFEKLANDLRSESGGKLNITVLPVGGAVAATETLNAISSGVLDGHYSAPSYFAGRDPAFSVLGDTGGAYDNTTQRDKWFEAGGLALARELYAKYGAHYVGPVYWAAEHIPSRKPLNGVDDFKGLKIRVPPGLVSDIISRAGASVVNLPAAEVSNALESGVIDATDWASPALNMQVGLYRVAKFSISAGHSMPTTEVSFNKRKWDAMPAELRQMIERGVAKMSIDLRKELDDEDAKALTEAKGMGVTVIDWPKAERARLRQSTTQVFDELAGKGDLAKKIVESHRQYMKSVGL
jgi:TRAP-type mannitol/chloroaromatic compound transport system substrate-binding protein